MMGVKGGKRWGLGWLDSNSGGDEGVVMVWKSKIGGGGRR